MRHWRWSWQEVGNHTYTFKAIIWVSIFIQNGKSILNWNCKYLEKLMIFNGKKTVHKALINKKTYLPVLTSDQGTCSTTHELLGSHKSCDVITNRRVVLMSFCNCKRWPHMTPKQQLQDYNLTPFNSQFVTLSSKYAPHTINILGNTEYMSNGAAIFVN